MAARKTGMSRELLIHPGETIQDILIDRNISQSELAASTGTTSAFISNVIAGKKDISNQFAMALEYALGVPKSFWLNLQKNYDAELLEISEVESVTEEEICLARELEVVVKHFREVGEMPSRLNIYEKVLALRKKLQVSNLSNLNNLVLSGNFRKADSKKSNPIVVRAWLRLAQLATEGRVAEHRFVPDDADELVSRLKDIMLHMSATEYVDALRATMSDFGISFAVVPHFAGAPINGYVTKGADGALRMAVTIRQSWEDIFWFSILHEIGHLVNGDLDRRKGEFLDDRSDEHKEVLADGFAKNALIDPVDYEAFIDSVIGDPSLRSIKKFAKTQNVTPGIVIGRLMKEKVIPWSSFPSERHRLKWAS